MKYFMWMKIPMKRFLHGALLILRIYANVLVLIVYRYLLPLQWFDTQSMLHFVIMILYSRYSTVPRGILICLENCGPTCLMLSRSFFLKIAGKVSI